MPEILSWLRRRFGVLSSCVTMAGVLLAYMSTGFIGFHHLLMVTLAASWILLALLLAGCTSSTGTMSAIYVLGLQYSTSVETESNVTSQFKMRVGYFGLCAQRNVETQWFCASGQQGIRSVIVASSDDPLDMIATGANFKSDVIFSGLLIGAMALTALTFAALATFPGWRDEYDVRTGETIEIKPFPSMPVVQSIAFGLLFAALLLLVSALWQHVAAATAVTTISSMSQGRLIAHVGGAATSLVWLSLVFVALACLGILVMIISLYTLDRLIDR